MTMSVAIVDDRDPLLRYVGAWYDAGSPQEFQGTTKWTATAGSTTSFTFVGTSLAVYGSVAVRTAPHASLSFVVDNSITGTYAVPTDIAADVHHVALWASPALANGSHTLVMTQTGVQADPGNGEIFLDYLLYDTTSTSVGAYFIDDRDPRITYTPAWRQFGSDEDFQHTSQGSTSTGDSLSLQFEGKGISFYGGINNGSAGQVLNASVVVDGGPPLVFCAAHSDRGHDDQQPDIQLGRPQGWEPHACRHGRERPHRMGGLFSCDAIHTILCLCCSRSIEQFSSVGIEAHWGVYRRRNWSCSPHRARGFGGTLPPTKTPWAARACTRGRSAFTSDAVFGFHCDELALAAQLRQSPVRCACCDWGPAADARNYTTEQWQQTRRHCCGAQRAATWCYFFLRAF
ncbi:hypothetical protein DFH06DRAFT_123673 [Mycena polygramma]|nr:hypothetical protein DFH06DRAFT_123673 [Mycena polygramma]